MSKHPTVAVQQASVEERPIVEKLLQLYLYDFSEIMGFNPGPDGVYGYRSYSGYGLSAYWEEPTRTAFLVRADGQLAGFVLVNRYTFRWPEGEASSIAEFFVMRRWRRQRVGQRAAVAVFDAFPGKWEVAQEGPNTAAQAFWRKTIGEYTKGVFEETVYDDDRWRGPAQHFDNSLRG